MRRKSSMWRIVAGSAWFAFFAIGSYFFIRQAEELWEGIFASFLVFVALVTQLMAFVKGKTPREKLSRVLKQHREP